MVDKTSPQYPAYIEECRKLFDEYDKKMEPYRSPPGFRGLDGDNTAPLCRERNRKLRELQKKYGFYEGELEPYSPPPPLSDAEKAERTKKAEEELESLLKEWGLR